MKKILVLLVIFTASIAICNAQPARVFESLSMYSKILQQEVKYSVILPEGYTQNSKRYPVVYMLHGLGDNESSWLEYGQANQVANKLVKEGEIKPMIYIMPQGYRNYYVNDFAGKFLYQDMFVKELIPFIDSTYRTIANKNNRATIGYSMGGFGALVLPLKHPELFAAAVPMSVSIRTEKQYMEEDSDGWDDQWGRLFGAVGKKGKERITPYYLENNPMAMIELQDKKQWKDLALYIDNGDDEETLSYSNEVLHQLLKKKGIAHEFRVRNGGHEFSYWRQSLINGLRFINDKFQQKAYRGDVEIKSTTNVKAITASITQIQLGNNNYPAFFPKEYATSKRKYPVMYVFGDMSSTVRQEMIQLASSQMLNNQLAPFIMVFLPANQDSLHEMILPTMEAKYSARAGFRFRSLLLYNNGAQAIKYALQSEQFTSCASIDADFDLNVFQNASPALTRKLLERTWFFFSTTDKSKYANANGDLHLLFKSKEIYHEYRVGQASLKPKNGNALLNEIFQFTTKKIHR